MATKKKTAKKDTKPKKTYHKMTLEEIGTVGRGSSMYTICVIKDFLHGKEFHKPVSVVRGFNYWVSKAHLVTFYAATGQTGSANKQRGSLNIYLPTRKGAAPFVYMLTVDMLKRIKAAIKSFNRIQRRPPQWYDSIIGRIGICGGGQRKVEAYTSGQDWLYDNCGNYEAMEWLYQVASEHNAEEMRILFGLTHVPGFKGPKKPTKKKVAKKKAKRKVARRR